MLSKITGWKAYAAGGLVIAALAGLSWLLWGQVSDARKRAETAETRVTELAGKLTGFQKAIDEMSRRQSETEATVAARMAEDNDMQRQLSALRIDLNEVMNNDPQSSAWADMPIPDALIGRLWGNPHHSTGAAEDRAGDAAGGADR
ncbi:hypothetical protein [Pusillimonas noertemannii]|uniref:LysB family phage lysis regulatory protein n=1 Tax=Pusillimonas noertemannii TaxID=305977 RepID=A0A2U1CMA6_9BURK|nr:hypothetical protein [Pusillimonas noertemannii]NYT68826.1 hypothetical protein [Pusillimonas noertemannii]PVY62150.1 hypothetical protein C7440_1642 [Pusillimonas noertemannii]TFL10861.1 hypothetical protein CSC72_10140 [Pusillimonas noertemannii]